MNFFGGYLPTARTAAWSSTGRTRCRLASAGQKKKHEEKHQH
jgi:hypothetical protein